MLGSLCPAPGSFSAYAARAQDHYQQFSCEESWLLSSNCMHLAAAGSHLPAGCRQGVPAHGRPLLLCKVSPVGPQLSSPRGSHLLHPDSRPAPGPAVSCVASLCEPRSHTVGLPCLAEGCAVRPYSHHRALQLLPCLLITYRAQVESQSLHRGGTLEQEKEA